MHIYDHASLNSSQNKKYFRRSCRDNQNTHFTYNTFFRPKTVPLKRYHAKIWYCQTGHRWQYNTAHTHSMLDNYGYRHTLRMWNTYRFSTAKMVMRTSLNVTLCTLPVLFKSTLAFQFPAATKLQNYTRTSNLAATSVWYV
jgi:hypothetical protein